MDIKGFFKNRISEFCFILIGFEIAIVLLTIPVLPIGMQTMCEKESSLCPLVPWWPEIVLIWLAVKVMLFYWMGSEWKEKKK
jgi:Ca2+/H+ antiporter